MKKAKIKITGKRIVIFSIILYVLINILMKIGIISYPTAYNKIHFYAYQKSYQQIVDYLSTSDFSKYFDEEFMPFDTGFYSHEYAETVARIEDEAVKNQVDYIMKSGNFDRIYIDKDDGKVFFAFDEIVVRKGGPVAIVYSKENLDGSQDMVWIDEQDGYTYTYEALVGDWYYEYRSR